MPENQAKNFNQDFLALGLTHLSMSQQFEWAWEKIISPLKPDEKNRAISWILFWFHQKWQDDFLDYYIQKKKYLSNSHVIPISMLQNLANKLWAQGDLAGCAHSLFSISERIRRVPLLKVMNHEMLHEQLKFINNASLTQSFCLSAIISGNINLFLKVYPLFYFQFSEQMNIAKKEHAALFEEMYLKIQKIGPQGSYLWQVVMVDLLLMTDLFTMHRTTLPIPYYKKKKEFSYALVFRSECITLYVTFWKYLLGAQLEQAIPYWEKLFAKEREIHSSRGKDAILNFWLLEKKLNNIKNNKLQNIALSAVDQSVLDVNIQDDESIRSSQIYDAKRYQEIFSLNRYEENKLRLLDSMTKDQSPFDAKYKLDQLLLSGQWPQAIQYIKNELNVDAHKSNIVHDFSHFDSEQKDKYYLLLELELKLNMAEQVLHNLQELYPVINLVNDFKSIKYLEAEALRALGRKREAKEEYKKVYDIDGNYRLVKWRMQEL